MTLKPTEYYYEALRYAKMAEIQQRECNLGPIPHINGSVKDPLMQNVKLYDVVERKYAGFSQIVLDVMYGDGKRHPYYGNMNTVRTPIAKSFKGWWNKADLATKFWVLLVHRLTGSAINYSQFPSGYHNTILPEFANHEPDMYALAHVFKHYDKPKFTSIGYQFAAFPKPDLGYRLGGEYFICTYLLDLCEHLAEWLESGKKRDLREVGEFMFKWNKDRGLRAFKFQYAAFISDLADFFPQYVNKQSPFYYGTNAIECIKYMFEPNKNFKGLAFFDEAMRITSDATGYTPYNIEDIFCDAIRWVENYIRPGVAYNHLDRDKIWSSCKIKDHPFGRQKKMLDHGLIKSFNDLGLHPSDDFIISRAGLTVEQYKALK